MYYLEERIGRLLEELEKRSFVTAARLPECEMLDSRTESFREAAESEAWQPFPRRERWGGIDQVCWFRFTWITPEVLAGKPLLFRIATGREGEWYPGGPQYMVYVNGSILHGMDLFHRQGRLSGSAVPGEAFTVYLQGFSGVKETLTGMQVDLLTEVPDARGLYFDVKTAYDSARLMAADDKTRFNVMETLNTALLRVDFRDSAAPAFIRSLQDARACLQETLYQTHHWDESYTAHIVGHTHLDIAWLWTVEDSRRKAARTFANTADFMERYPYYTFTATQPAAYAFVEEDYPELFRAAKEYIAQGRWEPEGAMWIEPDCNIPSGESFVRQLLLGKGYIRDRFGRDSRVFWAPDTFGFSAALPQILKKAGVEYFATTKLSWNDTNRFPSDIFRWRGIDGTEMLGYFTNQHAAYLGAEPLRDVWRDNRQKELASHVLVPFGWGDAGGGATEEMLETGLRLGQGVPGSPKMESSSLRRFMETLQEEVWENRRLPVWSGELYLELHRGTFTSNAKSKWYNRKSELLLHDAETFGCMARRQTDMAYPHNALRESWKLVALNQFHDILPGSSVKAVYERSFAEYEQILETGRRIVGESLAGIVGKIGLERDGVVIFNSLGFPVSDIVFVDKWDDGVNWLHDGETRRPLQCTADGHILFHADAVPAKGYKSFYPEEGPPAAATITARQNGSGFIVDSPFHTTRLDGRGGILSLFDKAANREVMAQGKTGNELQAFEDMPIYFNDAWDIAGYFDEKQWAAEAAGALVIEEQGPVRTVIRSDLRLSKSTIRQRIVFYENNPRIDFETEVDWKETFLLLKAAFPVNVHTGLSTCDIQFGSLQRPTHRNTSWEQAKFEICAHKWADLSQDDFGVSILNDCKYGYDIVDNQIRLTLLKAPEYPNEAADRHGHRFTYSLYAHACRLSAGGTLHQGYQLNVPLHSRTRRAGPGSLPDRFSLFCVDCDNVMLETVKQAENGSGTVLRLYEGCGRDGSVTLTAAYRLGTVWECDLMERPLREIPVTENSFTFDIKPFELLSFLVQ